MVNYKGINWKLYQGALIPDVLPHIEIDLSENEAKELLKATNAYFVRWIDEWDRDGGEFWYVIKDEREDLTKYSSNMRNQIRKGLKNCKVEKVSKTFLAENGYYVYKEAFKRYKTFLKPIPEAQFRKSIIDSENYDFFGVFHKDNLIAYAQNQVLGNVCNYSVIKLHPEFLKLYPGYALIYEMNIYYLNEKNFLYVSDGARNLSHQTNIQDFLIRKFRFRKAYCRLHIVYRKDIEFLVNVLYPLKNLIYKSNNKILQKIGVLLKHEEIRRSFE